MFLAVALACSACVHAIRTTRAWTRGAWGRRHLVSPASLLLFVYLQQVAISGYFGVAPDLDQDLPSSFRTWLASVSWAGFAYPFGVQFVTNEEWMPYVPSLANVTFYSTISALVALVAYPSLASAVSQYVLRSKAQVALSYGAIEEGELSAGKGKSFERLVWDPDQHLSLHGDEDREAIALLEPPQSQRVPPDFFYRPRRLLVLRSIAEVRSLAYPTTEGETDCENRLPGRC